MGNAVAGLVAAVPPHRIVTADRASCLQGPLADVAADAAVQTMRLLVAFAPTAIATRPAEMATEEASQARQDVKAVARLVAPAEATVEL